MFISTGSFAVGFVTGFGSGFMTREFTRVGQIGLRPIAKSLIKGGMLLAEKSRESLALAGETFEDLVAEARADLESEAVLGEATPVVAGTEAASAAAATGTGGAAVVTRAPSSKTAGGGAKPQGNGSSKAPSHEEGGSHASKGPV